MSDHFVAILMGSDSDLPQRLAAHLGIPCYLEIEDTWYPQDLYHFQGPSNNIGQSPYQLRQIFAVAMTLACRYQPRPS